MAEPRTIEGEAKKAIQSLGRFYVLGDPKEITLFAITVTPLLKERTKEQLKIKRKFIELYKEERKNHPLIGPMWEACKAQLGEKTLQSVFVKWIKDQRNVDMDSLKAALNGKPFPIQKIARNRKYLEDLLSDPKALQKAEDLVFARMKSLPKYSGKGADEFKANTAPFLPADPFSRKPPRKEQEEWRKANRLYLRLYLFGYIPSGNAEFRKKLEQLYGRSELAGLQRSARIDPRKRPGKPPESPKDPEGEATPQEYKIYMQKLKAYMQQDEKFKASQKEFRAYLAAKLDLGLAKPLDTKTLIAASVYLMAASEKDIAGLNLQPWKTTPVSVEVPKVPRIAVVGDSITGDFIGQKAGYPSFLLKKLHSMYRNPVVDAYGVRSQESEKIMGRFSNNISQKQYNTVIIQCGANDAMNGVDPNKTIHNIREMIRMARGKYVIVLTVTPQYEYLEYVEKTRKISAKKVQARIDAINRKIRRLAKEGITVVDLDPLGDGQKRMRKGLHKGDGVHLGPKGRAAVADLIFRAIKADAAKAAKAAAARPPIKKPRPLSDLEIYVKNCSTKLINFITKGDPAGFFKFQQNIPGEEKSLERVLFVLNYQKEITKTLIAAFKHMAQNDKEFKYFLKTRGQAGLPKEDLRLKPRARDAVQMLQVYINTRSRNGKELAKKLNKDLEVLNVRFLGLPHLMKVTGIPSVQTIAALAVYQWRINNSAIKAGGWAAPLKKPKAGPKKNVIDILDTLR